MHHREIILATNIAESSLTVPGMVYVIDFCLQKKLTTYQNSTICRLEVEEAIKKLIIIFPFTYSYTIIIFVYLDHLGRQKQLHST